jgi:hypothetical protein
MIHLFYTPEQMYREHGVTDTERVLLVADNEVINKQVVSPKGPNSVKNIDLVYHKHELKNCNIEHIYVLQGCEQIVFEMLGLYHSFPEKIRGIDSSFYTIDEASLAYGRRTYPQELVTMMGASESLRISQAIESAILNAGEPRVVICDSLTRFGYEQLQEAVAELYIPENEKLMTFPKKEEKRPYGRYIKRKHR